MSEEQAIQDLLDAFGKEALAWCKAGDTNVVGAGISAAGLTVFLAEIDGRERPSEYAGRPIHYAQVEPPSLA